MKNLPGSILIYVQFTFYAFYNFDNINVEGNEIYANNDLLVNDRFIDVNAATPLTEEYFFFLYDVGNTLTIKLGCITTGSPYD